MNLSYGLTGLIENYGKQDLLDNLGQAIAALKQDGVTDKTIFVVSAGNAHGYPCTAGSLNCIGSSSEAWRNDLDASSPEIFSGLPLRIEGLRPTWSPFRRSHRSRRLHPHRARGSGR